MAKAKKATVKKASKKKVTKKVKRKAKGPVIMTKRKLLNIITREPLVPNDWQSNITVDGQELPEYKPSKCVSCAVGAVISDVQKKGQLCNFNFKSIEMGSVYTLPEDDYYKALVNGGLFLTPLTDMFESLCHEYGIDGSDYTEALQFFYEKKLPKSKRSGDTGFDEDDFANKNTVARMRKTISNYNKNIKKVKKKMSSFIAANFPTKFELREEDHDMKYKALENTKYGTSGNVTRYDYDQSESDYEEEDEYESDDSDEYDDGY